MHYLLDTGIVSLPKKLGTDPRLLGRLERASTSSAISSTTLCELHHGVEKMPLGRRRDEFEVYLREVLEARLPVLSYGDVAARWHAAERARLEAIGRTPPFADSQIAAVAATNDLTLVTLNPRDFDGFEGLRVEDWS